MTKVFANSGDSDRMPQSAASDLDLRCLPITLLWVSRCRLQWETVCAIPLENVAFDMGSLKFQISLCIHKLRIFIGHSG